MTDRTKEKHEIDRIAKALHCKFGFDKLPNGKYLTDLSADTMFSLICADESFDLTEAKDALLSKLRQIICPDYEDYGVVRDAFDRQKLETERLQAEIKALKESRIEDIEKAFKAAYVGGMGKNAHEAWINYRNENLKETKNTGEG